MAQKRFVVIETTYGSVDAEMDDEQYQFENVFADHFTSIDEAEEYAREMNRTRSMGGRYSYRSAVRPSKGFIPMSKASY